MENNTGYSLSRSWFDFCFDNPEKIRPIHTAIYFFAIEHCNRLGWKHKFGFPSQMVMEAVGVKNWRTYSSALNELVDFGFIKMVEISKNQYSSNIIAIVKNTKAPTKALDKALSKHSQKQHTKQGQSTVSIDKQVTSNKEQLTINNIDFNIFWDLYDKKVGDKNLCKKKWLKLSDEDMNKIISILPEWKSQFKDKQFQPYPATFLNQERWNDEIKKTSTKINDYDVDELFGKED